ncbi:MAG TPA: DUF2322 family protein [Methylophilaceae bacterium]|nr:DUF2322 family protein [Methylophilaceae bacterium]
MTNFAENLATFDDVDHLQAIELYSHDGEIAALIENQAGSQGSLKLYHYLWEKYGEISVEAAKEGLVLYAEHTEDARQHPGKHPNIDRLQEVIDLGLPLTVETIPVGDA